MNPSRLPWLLAGATRPTVPRAMQRAPGAIVGLSAVAGAAYLLWRTEPFYPLRSWLCWPMLGLWAYELLLTAACGCFGVFLLRRRLRLVELGPLQTAALALPVGVVCFVTGIYAAGFLGLLGPVCGIVLPVVLLAAGLPETLFAISRWRAEPPARRDRSVWQYAAYAFGALGLLLVWAEVVSPDALNYDSTWTHLVIAQDYAREGRIYPFIADWNKNVPHLWSVLASWAFMVPGPSDAPLRWMLALHTELTVFIWTLVGVAALVRYVAGEHVRAGWTVVFLFPGLFVYDGSLGGSSDHMLALFAAPMFIAAAELARTFDRRWAYVLGLIVAGAVQTKYHAIYLVGPIAGWIAVRWAWLMLRKAHDRKRLLRSLITLGAVVLIIGGVHSIKNWVYFGNPFYPLMQSVFPSRYSVADGAWHVEYLFKDWQHHPPDGLFERLKAAAALMFDFSFTPHYSFVGPRPTFGSLFTLLLPAALLVPAARRLRTSYAVGLSAVFMWAFTFWVDRNLQTFMPLLAGAAGGAIVSAWRMGGLARAGVSVLVAAQLFAGADLMLTGTDRLVAGINLLRSGFAGQAASRFEQRKDYTDLGRALPRDATVLLHNHHVALGIDRRVLLDWVGFQGLIDYRGFKSPRDAFDRLEAVGVTHVVYVPGERSAATKQEEVLFDALAALAAATTHHTGPLAWFSLNGPPSAAQPWRVITVGLNGYSNGLYPIDALGVIEEYPPQLQRFPAPSTGFDGTTVPTQLLAQSQALVAAAASALDSATINTLQHEFIRAPSHGSLAVWVRR